MREYVIDIKRTSRCRQRVRCNRRRQISIQRGIHIAVKIVIVLLFAGDFRQ